MKVETHQFERTLTSRQFVGNSRQCVVDSAMDEPQPTSSRKEKILTNHGKNVKEDPNKGKNIRKKVLRQSVPVNP